MQPHQRDFLLFKADRLAAEADRHCAVVVACECSYDFLLPSFG